MPLLPPPTWGNTHVSLVESMREVIVKSSNKRQFELTFFQLWSITVVLSIESHLLIHFYNYLYNICKEAKIEGQNVVKKVAV